MLPIRRRRFRAWAVLFLKLAALSCVALTLFVGWELSRWEPFVSHDADPASIEANAAIKLPPSARDVHAYQEGLNEIWTQVRFTMAATDLPRFLQSTACTTLTPTNPQLLRHYESDPPWWTPQQAQHLEDCQGKRGHTGQHLLIDMTDPTTYIVYVSAGTN